MVSRYINKFWRIRLDWVIAVENEYESRDDDESM